MPTAENPISCATLTDTLMLVRRVFEARGLPAARIAETLLASAMAIVAEQSGASEAIGWADETVGAVAGTEAWWAFS